MIVLMPVSRIGSFGYSGDGGHAAELSRSTRYPPIRPANSMASEARNMVMPKMAVRGGACGVSWAVRAAVLMGFGWF